MKTRSRRVALCLSAAVCLSACATPEPSPAPPTVPAIDLAPSPAPTAVTTPPVPMPPALAAGDRDSPPAGDAIAPPPLESVLAYADRLRSLPANGLAQEQAALGEPGNLPVRQIQLALVLMHSHQPADTARALGLLQRVMAHPGPDSAPLKPLARLLAARLLDQRRLEDSLERQSQQLRDSQRRIEALNDRLEAMRAIERSLTPRSPSRTPTP
ncbi:hypothetical protein [Rhodoferax sp.]|uniref:hypothetical protein n=1 Tax=Rhodoferax sp. TaxID=50421 RepID=UPI0027316651|nr:hypothetical protein [Rhodoferax sp.]MDP2442154.1 hypothetical protein [Rhodoferax sp.]